MIYNVINIDSYHLSIGKIYEKFCELCHITVNKAAIFSDHGTITPNGVRIGKYRSHFGHTFVAFEFSTLVSEVFAHIIRFHDP